jgi:Calcineurin-like phosphoesterase/Purple acid Phosphatase, N-terminal domain
MSTDDDNALAFSRRKLLVAAGLYAGAATAASLLPLAPVRAATPNPGASSDPVTTPPVAGLHLQFGSDASSHVVVSWHTLQPVRNPLVVVGTTDGGLERTVAARQVSYTDAKSQHVVYAYHANVDGLKPRSEYLYCALHDGAEPQFGVFRTAPRGRAAFTFTSFGDQGTPTLGRKFVAPQGVTIPKPPPYVNDNLGSPAAGDTTLGVERVKPLFHLFNGDLCYANLADDRIRTWWDFWENNTRSARNRPWMPSPGNHENEITKGLWYAFTAGAVRVVSIANDDVCYQDGGNSYVRGYSNGAQEAWLENELATSRANRSIDWIVVCMHQVAISSVDHFNGADLGIREAWLPIFDKYEVDLVVCGHEHHYERSHPIRGRETNATQTPIPAATATDLIDTAKGTVHMVIGGGGTSLPSNQLFFDPPACRVITAVADTDPATGKRAPIYVKEPAPWSAVRNAAHSYGFAAFVVDPGSHPGDFTTITVTYYNVEGVNGEITAFETFTLRRRRRDGTTGF